MQRILIVGLGLIGGSFARALRKYGVAQEIYAYDFDIEAVEAAKNEKIIDGFFGVGQNFDLIVIATPLSSYQDVIEMICDLDLSQSVIIDLGSVKEFVNDLIPDELQDKFVLCHPIAGSDKTGFGNSNADLFFNKKFIISTQNKSTKIIENLVKKINAKPEFIDAKTHDEIYALISHLPQFLSFLTAEFSPKNSLNKAFRLDKSSPEIWEDIFELNEINIEKFYLQFFDNLQYFEKLLKEDIKKLVLDLQTLPYEQSEFSDDNVGSAHYFRLIIVASYLKITKINLLKSYKGSGFEDFTSIISLAKKANLIDELQKNRIEILKMIKSIS